MKKTISFLAVLMIAVSLYGQNRLNGQKETLATYLLGTTIGTTAYQNGNLVSGTPYACDCPVGYVAVGYQGNKGLLIDNFVLRCRLLNADGTLGTTVTVTAPNGLSTGGNFVGPFDLPTGMALVGMHIRAGDNYDLVEGFGQPIANIAGGFSNSIGTSAAVLIGNPSGGTDMGTIWIPDGNVMVGMMVYPTNYACGAAWRYAPIYNTTGIEASESQNKIAVYPNPAATTLNISGLTTEATAEVYDISGKLLLTQQIANQPLDINSLAKGLYFIKLNTKEGSVLRKFVKE